VHFKLILLTLLIFITRSAISQRDTICTKKLDTIPCIILKAGSQYIEYKDKTGREKTIETFQVKWYSYKGTKLIVPKKGGLFATHLTDTVNGGDELRHLRFCLHKFHNQYSTGMSLTMIGGVATASSFFMSQDNPIKNGLGIGGLLVMVTGTLFTFDAHKWIGRAGWGVNGKGNEIEIYYRFR